MSLKESAMIGLSGAVAACVAWAVLLGMLYSAAWAVGSGLRSGFGDVVNIDTGMTISNNTFRSTDKQPGLQVTAPMRETGP